MATMSCDNRSYCASLREEIETHLKEVVTVRPPVSVFEPMRHLVLAAPHNTASALCIATCELVGGCRDQAVVAASALHVVHAALFTHENLPLSDRPNLLPKFDTTVQHVYDPNIELLTADGIIPFGLELLARADDPAQNNSNNILRVMIEITHAIGSQGMIKGQYNEIQYNQSDDDYRSRHIDLIDNICKKKEGGFHACGGACGAILGGGSEEEVEKMRRYGFYVGMIQGISRRLKLPKESGKLEELRNLALEELKGFDEAKVEGISSFLEGNLGI